MDNLALLTAEVPTGARFETIARIARNLKLPLAFLIGHTVLDDNGRPLGEHGPCGCLSDDPVHNPHSIAEHTECWGWPPCGGCDSCGCLQAAGSRRAAQ